MNNQLSIAKGDHNSSTALSKPQKIQTSSVNLHLRTESNAQNEDPHSPQRSPPELRDTVRRPRMPYNKLPEAFNMKNKKKKTNKEVIQNLDRIVKISQYRQIQQILDPIPIQNKGQSKSKEHYANPLATIHKYFKMESRFRSKMEDLDRSSHKSKPFSVKQTGIRITQCITLEILKHKNNTGTLKKILFVPTMNLLTSKEQPLNSKDHRLSIKSWLQAWQQSFSSIPQFLHLQGYLFNIPEGAISVITEYCSHGSLVNLLDSVFTLPQTVIQQIFLQIFSTLQKFYQIPDNPFTHLGGLSPSQILFNSDGKVKIGLGLYYHLASNNSSGLPSLYHVRNQIKKNIFDMNSTQKNFMKLNNNQENKDKDRSLDIFKLGLMMLQCAIGKFQNFQQSPLIQEAIQNIFTQEGQILLQKENVCCLIHSEQFLLETLSHHNEMSRRDRIQISKITPYSKFLKDRFSIPFQNFLCCCLKLSHSQRSTLQDLNKKHSFLRNQVYKDAKTVNITLSDLLLINIDWSQDLLQSVQQDQGERLITHILHVLSDCRKDVINNLVANEKQKILKIGKYIGFNYPGIGDRLYQTIQQLANHRKDFNTSI